MIEIVKKFKFKAAATVLHAPIVFTEAFQEMGFTSSLDSENLSENTLVFVQNKADFIDFLSNKLKHVVPDSVLWFAYPKGTSGIKTDIHRDILRDTATEFGLAAVTAVSIDNTWSALRFRPTDKVGKK